MTKGVAVVTGSAQGLGKAIASRLSRDGFAVVINDLASKQAQIDAVVKEIEASGGTAIGIAADVTSRAEVQNLVDRATEQLGEPLQVMVANAGLAHADGIFELSEEHVQRILNVNIVGVFNCFVVAGKKMVDQRKGGKIMAASSIAAFKGMALVSAYTASKWAVRGLTQTFAVELGALSKDHEKTINVNCYAPGVVGTPMWSVMVDKLQEMRAPKREGKTYIEEFALNLTTLGRVSVPDDVANAVSFLAGPDSDWVTGQSLVVDGGIAFN
ncbi:uncharacterized protein Z520_00593 [Fonsecaea multimorphosa CBS 102226]|uniref:Diacetyl reductase [(S)-acetoin forming] n=1 Tax=Fonsecaea multimorphosa CBS 102226 TaxID=1442371 RepID=A0A0D2HPX0_9EURO|nr:uncharacterized protein Z520_00593 [Fonsecaea multimorphosa CBS 102226]KIY03901.1 hypothetical protein Z520_00593 [Fonsecaea multimorphosa CBS 102226]